MLSTSYLFSGIHDWSCSSWEEVSREAGCMANFFTPILNVETAGICTVEMEMRSDIGKFDMLLF